VKYQDQKSEIIYSVKKTDISELPAMPKKTSGSGAESQNKSFKVDYNSSGLLV